MFSSMSVNVICPSDEFLRDRLLSIPPGLFCFLMLLSKREGVCVFLQLRKDIRVYYPKVTYVFMGSLSFSVVEPWINESKTF